AHPADGGRPAPGGGRPLRGRRAGVPRRAADEVLALKAAPPPSPVASLGEHMSIIDVDSHFMEPADWLLQTDLVLAGELAPLACPEYSAEIILGEALKKVSADRRPDRLARL